MLRTLIVFGTRPEAIKMAPLVKECQRREKEVETLVCLSGQHREMLEQVTNYFGIEADVDLNLMRPDQTLGSLTARCIEGFDEAIARLKPDCIVVQGDTTTTMAASLAAFYRKVPLVHIEAGLRTGDRWAPWPEEVNRKITSLVTWLHCPPTERAAQHLIEEGVDPSTVHVTGNTVIDALLWSVEQERRKSAHWKEKYAMLGEERVVLITGHRRENFGGGMERFCSAIASLAEQFPDVHFVYPVHLNPNVREPVNRLLAGAKNIHLLEPAPYPEFVWLMDRSSIILTDSGGVQEEAPSLGRPVLVTRDVTERPEAVESGAVELVGTSVDKIKDRVSLLLTDEEEYKRRQIKQNPYGDGKASERIVDLMMNNMPSQ